MNRIIFEKNIDKLYGDKGWATSIHRFANEGNYFSLKVSASSSNIFEEDENGETALQIAERRLRDYQKCVDYLRKREKECYDFDEESFIEDGDEYQKKKIEFFQTINDGCAKTLNLLEIQKIVKIPTLDVKLRDGAVQIEEVDVLKEIEPFNTKFNKSLHEVCIKTANDIIEKEETNITNPCDTD